MKVIHHVSPANFTDLLLDAVFYLDLNKFKQGNDTYSHFTDDQLNDAEIIKRKIRAPLSQPYHLDSMQLHIYPSVGVAVYPDHGENESELIHHADSAMYLAKKGQAN